MKCNLFMGPAFPYLYPCEQIRTQDKTRLFQFSPGFGTPLKLFHFGVRGEAVLEMKDGPFAADRQGLAANRLALRRSRVVVVNSEFKRRGLTTSGAIHEGERK